MRMPLTKLPWRRWLGVELVEVSSAERWIAGAGGGLAILLVLTLCRRFLPLPESLAVVGSMGATAVLLFGVPHGPLSQPWPVIAGHGISALIGVLCARFIPVPTLGAACAVGLAIWVMHRFRCIHPPGGATAFTAVLGGPALRDLGFGYVLFPVLANAVLMVAFAVLINRPFPWRRYPASTQAPPARDPARPPEPAGPTHAQVVQALRSLDSFVDISEEDLLRLTRLLARDSAPAPGRPGGPGSHRPQG